MRITLYEFKALPEQEQYYLIFNEAIYIDRRFENEKRFALYSLDMFFVEVEYNAKENKIVKKVEFKTGTLLDKYSN